MAAQCDLCTTRVGGWLSKCNLRHWLSRKARENLAHTHAVLPRVDSPTTHHVGKLEVRVRAAQLSDTPDGSSAHDGAGGQLVNGLVVQASLDHKGVAGVMALEEGADLASLADSGGDVLARVDEQVHAAVEQRALELVRPQRLGRSGRVVGREQVQGGGLVTVARSGHVHDGERGALVGGCEGVGDHVGLDEGKVGLARADDEGVGGGHGVGGIG